MFSFKTIAKAISHALTGNSVRHVLWNYTGLNFHDSEAVMRQWGIAGRREHPDFIVAAAFAVQQVGE